MSVFTLKLEFFQFFSFLPQKISIFDHVQPLSRFLQILGTNSQVIHHVFLPICGQFIQLAYIKTQFSISNQAGTNPIPETCKFI